MALPPLVEEIADALFKHFFGVEARKHFGAGSSPLKRARRGRRHRIRSRRSRASNALATAPKLRGGTDIRCSHALLLPFETRAARAKSSNSLSTQSRVKRTRYRNTTTGGGQRHEMSSPHKKMASQHFWWKLYSVFFCGERGLWAMNWPFLAFFITISFRYLLWLWILFTQKGSSHGGTRRHPVRRYAIHPPEVCCGESPL